MKLLPMLVNITRSNCSVVEWRRNGEVATPKQYFGVVGLEYARDSQFNAKRRHVVNRILFGLTALYFFLLSTLSVNITLTPL